MGLVKDGFGVLFGHWVLIAEQNKGNNEKSGDV